MWRYALQEHRKGSCEQLTLECYYLCISKSKKLSRKGRRSAGVNEELADKIKGEKVKMG